MLPQNKSDLLSDTPNHITLLLAEYYVLREEILKRMELQHQVLSLTLVILGTLFTFGLQNRTASIILLYPIVATFLVAAWAYSDDRIREVGDYIRDQVEAQVEETHMKWEHSLAMTRAKHPVSLHFLSSLGIFIGSEIIAILLGSSIARFNTEENLLFSLSMLSIAFSIVMLLRGRRQ